MVKNSSVPESVLNKINNAICYYRVRESHADGTFRVRWIPGEYNHADLLIRNTMKGNMRHRIVELTFYKKSVVIREKDES